MSRVILVLDICFNKGHNTKMNVKVFCTRHNDITYTYEQSDGTSYPWNKFDVTYWILLIEWEE